MFVKKVRLVSALATGLVLSGCGSLSQYLGNTGVGIPSPSKITAFYQETEDGAIIDATGARITAGQYIIASITYTNEKCHLFFDTLEAFKQDSEFLDLVLTAAVAAGSPLLALTSSAKTVASVTSAVTFGNQINKYASDIYAFATFKEPLKKHVFQALADYQAQKGLDLYVQHRFGIVVAERFPGEEGLRDVTLNTTPPRRIRLDRNKMLAFFNEYDPINMLIARSIAADYASICSLANMRRIVVESLSVTRTSATGSPNPAAPSVTETESDPAQR